MECSTSSEKAGNYNYSDTQNISPEFIKNASKSKRKLDLIKAFDDKNALIYFYVFNSLNYADDKKKWVQRGCSPNFEGGITTLCCCKHLMRSSSYFLNEDIKNNTWIAGFTGSVKHGHKNGLFYLAKVREVAHTYPDLEELLESRAKTKKNARFNRLGDLYELEKDGDEYNSKNYYKPLEEHCHRMWKNKEVNWWKKDIDYKNGKSGNHHQLVIFDENKTFVWEAPIFKYNKSIGRGHRVLPMVEFIDNLIVSENVKQNAKGRTTSGRC